MKKYAVASYDGFGNGNNVIKIVEAENEFDAVLMAVEGELVNYQEAKTLSELINRYGDADLEVSYPVEI